MNKVVGIFEAKTHLSDLVDRAERGETITITRRGKPVARLSPPAPAHDVARAKAAAASLRELQASLRSQPFTADEIRSMRNEGRR